MVMAPALLIPFAEAAGLTIAGLGAIEIGKKVQDFVDNNPDATMEILTMLVPGGQGLSTLFKKKAKPVEEEIEISVEEKDPRDLTRKEKAEIMKETAKSSSNKSRDMKKAFEDIIKPGKEEDEFLEGEERYDGGLEELGKAKGYDYKKFFKADGGRVGYNLGGRATTQDYAGALRRVSAGTTYQQQAQAKDYARNEAANELRAALRNTVGMGPSSNTPISNLYNNYGFNTLPGGSRLFGKRGNNFSGVAQRYGGGGDYDRVLDQMVSKKLQPTFYAPPPKPTYRAVSPEAQALNMDQSTYQDIISSGKDPRQYYMDFNNRVLTEAKNPNLLTYGQVMAGPGFGMSQLQNVTQAQVDAAMQKMQNNPGGYQDFDEAVKYYSSNDPYMNFKEEVRDVVDGRETGYMSGQDYYDTKVLGLDGKGIAEKYGLPYADGGRVGMFMGGSPLEGPALNIYNSMNSYGFTDQEIADALSARNLYEPSSTPASDTPVTNTATNIINQGGDGGNNSNTLQSFRQDPSVMPAFEALQRNQQLTSMGINDPFANEASLSGAYYGDMPTDTSNQVGVYQPGIMENIKNKIGGTKIGSMFTGAVDQLTNNKFANTLGTALTFAKSPLIGGAKMLASGLSGLTNMLPPNQRAINENIAANLGIGVDNIGRIQGDYGTVGGVMSGYNLNQMDADTFDKRTDSITQTLTDKYGFTVEEIEDIIDGTYKGNKGFNKIMGKQTNLVRDLRNINLAKGIILNSKELGLKELERIEKEKAAAALKAQRDELTYSGPAFTNQDGSTISQDFSTPAGLSNYDVDVLRADGGMVGYKDGGLATMFVRKR